MIDLIKQLCVLKTKDKPFILASGKTSNYYIDIRKASMIPSALTQISNALMWKIIDFKPYAKLVAGVALGGCALATGVSLISDEWGYPILNTLYVRKEVKEYGTTKLIEGDYNFGDGVVLCEDVITSGGSALKAIKVLRDAGLSVKGVVAVLDREEGGTEAIRRECPVSVLVKMSELIDKE